jgi:hypothetical protein
MLTDAESLWVWIGAVEAAGKLTFLYGCAAPTERTASGVLTSSSSEMQDNRKLHFFSALIRPDLILTASGLLHEWQQVLSTLFDIKLTFGPSDFTRNLMHFGLGHTVVRVSLTSTLPDIESEELTPLHELMSPMEAELGLPFTTSYASRVGSFEIFDLKPPFEGPPEIQIVSQRLPGQKSGPIEAIRIDRSGSLSLQSLSVHTAFRAEGNLLAEFLSPCGPGTSDLVVLPTGKYFDEVDCWVFTACDGQLVYYEHMNYIMSIPIGIAMQSGRIALSDALTKSLQGVDKAVAKSAAMVTRRSAERLTVDAGDSDWRRFNKRATELNRAGIDDGRRDRWFPRGLISEAKAIQFFDELMDGRQTKAAILVDPFFGCEALSRLVLRLGSHDVKLTIVTSWTNRNPDTDKPLEQLNITSALEDELERLRRFMSINLQVVNLIDGSRQAFHDRYLLIYAHDTAPKVYLLSNSVNRIAARWPFVMSLLDESVRPEVQAYIEGLTMGEDVTGCTKPAVTLRWNSHVA